MEINHSLQRPRHIELIGEIRLTAGEQAITRFATQKVAALLAYLALRMPTAVTRETLIEMLWPDQDLDAARNSLSVALSSLRRQLEPPGSTAGSVLIADRSNVRLNPAAVTTDLQEFERLLTAVGKGGETQADPLTQAIALYRGEFTQGHYFDWVLRERVRLQTLYVEALLRLAVVQEQSGAFSEALLAAQRALDTDPFHEPAHLAVIRLQVALGRPALALDAASKLERAFREEFGAEPSESTRRFLARLCHNPNALTTSGTLQDDASGGGQPPPQTGEDAPGTDRTRAVVARRLQPGEPDHGAVRSEPNATEEPAARRKTHPEPAQPGRSKEVATVDLPLRLTRLFGRAAEIEQIVEMLCPQQGEGYRLVTLTGSGGAGKTRLSQEVGAALATRFPGRICFVPLAALSDPSNIPGAILNALKVRAPSTAEPFEQAAAALRQQPTLLILDNLEQLLRGDLLPGSTPSPTDAAGILYRLLAQAPTLTCLCSSRRRLGLEGEREFRVAPLRLPRDDAGLEELASVPSVALYLDRAQAVRADFQLTPGNATTIAQLCQRLEGIPLAIELAAAWVRTLPPRPMLQRLENRLALPAARRDDVPVRHRSLVAVLDWSYALLTPEQQRFFTRVGIFAGGWTLTASEVVCSEPEALEMTEGLLAASLAYEDAEGEEPRFRFLDTVRQYALERLAESGEIEAARERHLQFFLAFAEEAGPKLKGPEQAEWLARLEAEHDNLRAALEWSLSENEAAEKALRLCAALERFWWTHGHFSEGRVWCVRALRKQGGPERTKARAATLNSVAVLARMQGDLASARAYHEECLTIWRALGDRWGLAGPLGNLGNVARMQGDYASARAYHEESLVIFREIGDRLGIAGSLGNLGNVARMQGDYVSARTYHEEGLVVFREIGDRLGIAGSLINLGSVAYILGDYASMHSFSAEGLVIFQELGAHSHIAACLDAFANLAARTHRLEQATVLRGAAEALREQIGVPLQPNEREPYDRAVAELSGSLAEATFTAAWARGRAMAMEQAIDYALALSGT